MAFRIQGQKDAFDGIIAGAPANAVLESIEAIIDWEAVRAILARGYDESGRGWVGIDPVVLFKMLLLEQIYNLSDVRVSVEAGDRLSFRRFLALPAGESAPDDTTLVKFRARMRKKGLLEEAHAEFNRQLKASGLFVKPGAIRVVDATVIRAATRPPRSEAVEETPAETPAQAPAPESPVAATPGACVDAPAQQSAATPTPRTDEPRPGPARPSRLDADAAFGGKKGKLQFGYKLHAGIDTVTGMIPDFEVTAANVADTDVFEQVLGDGIAGGLADKGYDSAKNRAALEKRGASDGIMRRIRAKCPPPIRAIETARNRALSKLRSPSEGVFCALKRWRRLGRAVYTGIVRFREQVSLAILAHNLLKAIQRRESRA